MRLLWLLVLLACLAAPATAQATWTGVGTISVAGGDAFSPQVAVAPNGNAVFVWQRFDGANQRIQARARAAGGTLSSIQTLSPVGQEASDPRVGVDSSGNAVFTWQLFDGAENRIQTRARSAAGTLSSIQTLSSVGFNAFDPRVGVDSSGDAVFVWRRFNGANDLIQARARSAGGTLSSVQRLSAPGEDAAFPGVAVDSSGNAVFAWRRFDGTAQCGTSGCPRIQALARSAAGTLSTVQTLSPAGTPADLPQIGVDSSGNAVIVWQAVVASNSRIQTRARTAAGGLSSVQTLSLAGQNAENPQVGVDSSGNTVFVWQRFDGTNERTQARDRSAAGTLSSIQTLSAAGRDADIPQIGVDSSGNAVFVWRLIGTPDRIQARSRSAGGTFSPVQTVSPAGLNADQPAVSADPDGGLDPNSADGAVVWDVFDGTNNRVQAATQIAPVTVGGGSNQFNPATATVNQGDSVTWKNAGGLHNVHFDDNSFVQPPTPSSSAWTVSRTFNTAGSFRYYCEVHGGPGGVGMSGTIVVA